VCLKNGYLANIEPYFLLPRGKLKSSKLQNITRRANKKLLLIFEMQFLISKELFFISLNPPQAAPRPVNFSLCETI